MAHQWFKTQYPGVRFREHTTRKFNSKPDRYFSIYYKLNGKQREEGLGWSSEEWTAQKASIQLAELKKAQTTGEGCYTLQEKRELAEQVRKAEDQKKAEEQRQQTTFKEISGKYLEWAKTNKRSWKDDEARLRLHILPLLGPLPCSQIDIPEVEQLKTACQSKKLAPATVVQCLSLVRAVFYFAIKQRLFKGANPVIGVKFPKVDNRRMRFLSREEADALLKLAASYNMELHDLCLISLHTGMRAGECIVLTWRDVDFPHGLITVKDPKNGESRQVFMTKAVKEMLQRRIKQPQVNILVFPSGNGEMRIRFSKIFKRCVDKLKLNEGITDRRDKIVFHSIRHSCCSYLAMQGVPLLTIKEMIGWKTLSQAARYAHLNENHVRQAVNQLEQYLSEKEPEAKREPATA